MIALDEAEGIVESFYRRLKSVSAVVTDIKLSPDAWSLREIVGHLVDSASNNHQRFVRLQQNNLEGFPGYDQEFWVERQGYNSVDWQALRELWVLYNRLLLHVIGLAYQNDRLRNSWISENGSHTLEWIIDDYFRHLRWHVQQFEERLDQVTS